MTEAEIAKAARELVRRRMENNSSLSPSVRARLELLLELSDQELVDFKRYLEAQQDDITYVE